ncbi:universal stress protein [Lentzea sp. NPDC051838]|uniref:universal stress protein n=1 Tax=Lentzea sp. NPDC051838 TaxID=3154849 RepID=UPI003437D366
MTVHPVVVGVDGSEAARDAAIWAAGEAVSRGRVLLLLHVVRWPLYADAYSANTASVSGHELQREWADAMLADVREECRRRHPDVLAEESVALGDPAEVLLEASADAAVMVLGPRGEGRLSEMFLGSTVMHVVQRCKAPVVVVRGQDDAAERTVVVGVDGSEASAHALAFAHEYASRRGSRLVAVHAWSDVPLDIVLRERRVDFSATLADARMAVAHSLSRWTRKHPEVPAEIVITSERPADTLVEEAEGAELLVVGSRGRGPVRRALLGSVGHAVVQEAPCPVAVVPVPLSG